MNIKVEDLSLLYEGKQVLKGINIEYPLGQIHVLLGASGAGKSSFLRILNALTDPSAGSIRLGDMVYSETQPRQIRKRVGMVFQKPALFEGSVYENLIWGLKTQKKKIDEAEISEILTSLDIPLEYLDKDIENLSVGEQQRICIVRTVLVDPDVILFDEPVSALDPKNAKLVLGLIKKINGLHFATTSSRQFGISTSPPHSKGEEIDVPKKTIFLVSHIIESAIEIADTISFFHQGEIIFYGSKDDYINSENEVIKNFKETENE